MAITSNTYTGNGTNKLFSITFPYLDTSDINVYLNGVLQTITTQYFFANATTVEFVTAPSNGATVLLDRSTNDSAPNATFFPGSSIKASDLNVNFDQAIYIAQETANSAANQSTAGLQTQITAATNTANTAITTANTANATANTANTTANGIAATANTALTNANAAVVTANAALPLTGGTLTGNLVVPSINGGPLAGFRNAIINGNFDIWQRGTSFTGNGHSADRWVSGVTGSTFTATRQPFTLGQTAVPGEPTYFCRTVVNSVAGAANYSALFQRIEGVRTFAGQQVTLSFWAKVDATKNIAVSFQQAFGTGGSPSSAVDNIGVTKISIGTSWQKVIVTATMPSISGKTLGTDNNDTLDLVIWFDAGSDYNSRTDSLGRQSGTFEIAQVQLERGPVATPFEQRPQQVELALCQRYYSTRSNVYLLGYGLNATSFATHVSFPVEMRKIPTVTLSNLVYVNASAGTANNVSSGGFALNATASSTASASVNATFVANAEVI